MNKNFKMFKDILTAYYYGQASTASDHNYICACVSATKNALKKNDIITANKIMYNVLSYVGAPVNHNSWFLSPRWISRGISFPLIS